MIEHAIKDFMFLWATIDPIGTVFIFAALTARYDAEMRKNIARKACIYAGLVLLGTIVLGQLILSMMGIRMISFQVAGGIVLFLFALQMVFSNLSEMDAQKEDDHDIAVFPLAIPTIATPGAIMAAILLTDNKAYNMWEQLTTTVVLLSVLAITYFMMLASERILKFTGKNGASIMVKVMGMLLVALSVELVMEAIGIERWLNPYTD
jgi:multiple antibiotic resistance protein